MRFLPRRHSSVEEIVARVPEVEELVTIKDLDPLMGLPSYFSGLSCLRTDEEINAAMDQIFEGASNKDCALILSRLEEYSTTDGGWYTGDWHLDNLDRFADSPHAETILKAAASRIADPTIAAFEKLALYDFFYPVLECAFNEGAITNLRQLTELPIERLSTDKADWLRDKIQSRVERSSKTSVYYTLDRQQRNLNLDTVMTDPALNELSLISLRDCDIPEQLAQSALRIESNLNILIARNLHARGMNVRDADYQREINLIAEKRQEFAELSIAKDRNVLVLAHNESHPDGGYRFATEALQTHFKKLAKEFNVERPGYGFSPGQGLAPLMQYASSPSPFTFIFEGHGAEESIELARGKSMHINEFLQFFKKRLLFQNDSTPDIFMFGCCKAQNFVRSLVERLPDYFQKPIILGIGEYKQLSYTNYGSPEGSVVWEAWFNSSVEAPGTIGAFCDLPSNYRNGKPFAFCNGPDNALLQIR